MRNRIIRLAFLSILAVVFSFSASAQTKNANYNVNFASGVQNMWGPSWSAVSINQTITLFEESWNTSWNTGSGGIVTIAGQSFGAAASGSFSGLIGMSFTLSDFTTGTVEVDYPITITNTMNADDSFDPGDNVFIQTEHTVNNGASLETLYPNAGEASLDLYFEMGMSLTATLCAFGCTTFDIIPSFNTGLLNVNLFTINQNGADFITFTGGGITIGPYESYPGLPLTTDMIPNDPLAEVGLWGQLDLPYVTTYDYVAGDNIYACGGTNDPGDGYIQIQLNVFDLLGNLPAPVGPVLANLDGSEDLLGGLATVSWSFFSTFVNLEIHNKQCFSFTPKVYGRYEFPVAVEYTTTDPGGALVDSGTSSIINVEIGGDINYKFPCYYDSINITPTYSIDGIFRNHTYDSLAIFVTMSAFYFEIDIPAIEITPEIYVPEICVPIPYPCPSWSCPWCWCTYTACTPAFTIPAIGFPGLTISVPFDGNPLWETQIDIASFEYDWYDNTWSLEGFQQYTMSPFYMEARPMTIDVISQNNVSCHGGSNGSINVDITQTAYDPVTFTYSWSNGSTVQDPSGLSAGPHELIVYDSHGCQLFTGTTILEPTHPVTIDYDVTDKLCNGGPNDGQIDITASGGTPNYTYAWTGPGGYTSTAQDITGLAPGSYTVTVTDANGCVESATIIVGEPYLLGQSAAINHIDCNGNDNGEIQVDVFGGTLPYTYAWSSGETSQDIDTITAGSYTLTVTDINGCTSIQTYNVLEPAAPLSVTATWVDILCKDDATGSIDVTTTGGTPGYSYAWSNATSGVVLPYVTEDVTGLVDGIYTLLVTDANGCKTQLTQAITEPAASLSSTPILVDILCFGASTGSIDPVVAGGTPGYTYSWSTGATTPTITNVPAGTYDLLVTDANGCTDNYSYTLTEPASGLTLTLSGTDILCFGESTGVVTTDVGGGTPEYTYLWSNGAVTANIEDVPAGNYSVTVTDDNGCTISDNLTLIEPAAPLALSTVVTDVDCYGNNTGSIDLTITGGTYPYEQLWSNSASFVMIDTTEDISNQYADSYTVLVTDDNGCTETLTSTINQPAQPLAITGIVDDANCFGLNDGAIDATVTGGTTTYSYSWSNGATTEDLTAILAGSYTLTVTDLNGCVESMSFEVDEPIAPLSIATFVTDVDCNGDNTGILEAEVQGGTMPYTYAWSNGETTAEITDLLAGTYTLTVTDAQGCTAFTGATVNEPTALVVTPTVTDASCYGFDDGQIILTISGGVQPYYFDWGNQNNILLNNPSETLDGLIANDYFIRVRDANGCVSEQIVTVGEPNPYVATYIITDVDCNGNATGAIDLTYSGGTAPYSTVWSDGQTTEDAVNLVAGMYTFTGTDTQGCILSDSIYIAEPDSIQISYTIEEVSCIDQTDASIYVTPFGGTAPYSYSWSDGTTNQNATDLAPGFYTLTITDDNTCVQTFDFEIMINPDECLDIPNTITPNGDNYNDTWYIENIDLYPNAMVKIFNKWGNEIFSSEGVYEPWDGTHHGNPLPSTVYYYIIKLNNPDQNEYTGTITIVR